MKTCIICGKADHGETPCDFSTLEIDQENMEFDKAVELAKESEWALVTPSVDDLYDDENYGECDYCGEYHILCPICEFCLKYCHDDATCGIDCWPEDD